MKPRINLAQSILPDGSQIILEEHDGRISLVSHGQQICGPATKHCEYELARLACAPFRPARQPKIWVAGIGLGHTLAGICQELKQRRAQFIVAEPMDVLVQWHRLHLHESPLNHDGRIQTQTDTSAAALRSHTGTLHAIVVFLETAPLAVNTRPLPEDHAWLAAAYDALQPGGMLAIAALKPSRQVTRGLQRAGFDVVESTALSSPEARRTRQHPVWLARK